MKPTDGTLSKGILDQCYFLTFKITIDLLTRTYSAFQNAVHSNYLILNECFLNSHFTLFLYILLFKVFNIELNPGPQNSPSDLSVLHMNTRSIRNKLKYIRDIFLDYILWFFFKTHLDVQFSNDSLLLSDFFDAPNRKDRSDHGAIILFKLRTHPYKKAGPGNILR